MSDDAAILYRLELDSLTADRAIYTGANDLAATIDRATFNAQGHPTHVVLWVPKAPYQEDDFAGRSGQ